MKIRLAKTAGFCMGVRRAVDMVLDLQRDSPPLPIVTYGPLIHNPQTLELLRSRGIQEAKSLDQISGGTVVIRAHGISPLERSTLESKGVGIIDATCPRVARVQAVIRKHAGKGHFCVIVGDEDHPEVRGLMGFASAGSIAVPSCEENGFLDSLPRDREICVVAQTTQDIETFDGVVKVIRGCCPNLHVYNTICDSTKSRQAEVSQMARQVDVVVVVGGRGSGNTQRLVKVAQAQGISALHVETDDDVSSHAFAGVGSVGRDGRSQYAELADTACYGSTQRNRNDSHAQPSEASSKNKRHSNHDLLLGGCGRRQPYGNLSRASGTAGHMAPIGRDHAVCLCHAFAKQNSGKGRCSAIQHA